jgi:hypothetical protein
MPDALPPKPTDLFTRLTPVLDAARGVIQGLGLRPYRVYLLTERWTGPGPKEGILEELVWDEVLPSPEVIHLSAARIASSGGQYQAGAVELRKISRERRREELLGRTRFGHALARHLSFYVAAVPKGQLFAELYNPASDPVLEPLAWRLVLNPVNRRIPAPHLDP